MTPPVTLGGNTGPLTWQKSSFSSSDGNTNCVEVAVGTSRLHVRESNDPSVILSAQPAAFRTLMAHLKSARIA